MELLRKLQSAYFFSRRRYLDCLMTSLEIYIRTMEAKPSLNFYVQYSLLLKGLAEFIDIPDDEYFEKHDKHDKKNGMTARRLHRLQTYSATLERYAEAFATFDFRLAMLCLKARLKLACLLGDDITTKTVFYNKLIKQHSCLYDYDQCFRWAAAGIAEARKSGDATIEYYFLCTRWQYCNNGLKTDPDLSLNVLNNNFESDLMSFVESHGGLEHVNEELKAIEDRKLLEKGDDYRDDYDFRIFLLNYTADIANMLSSLSDGDYKDTQAWDNYEEVLSFEDLKREDIMQMWASRDQLHGDTSEETDRLLFKGRREDATPEAVIPPELDESQKFFMTAHYASILAQSGHTEAAMKFYKEVEEQADESANPFVHAVKELTKSRITQSSGNDLEKTIEEKTNALELLQLANDTGHESTLEKMMHYTIHTERGSFYFENEPEKAIEEFTKAIEVLKSMSMGQALRIAELLIFRALTYDVLNKKEEMENDLCLAIDTITDDVKTRLPLMDRTTKETYWAKVSKTLNAIIGQVGEDSGQRLIAKAYGAVLMSKGLLLSSEKTVKDLIETKPELQHLRKDFREVQDHIMYGSDLNRAPGGSAKGKPFWHRMKEMAINEEINKVILDHCAYLHDTFGGIRARLKDNQAIVDYYDFETDDDHAIVAFITRSTMESPVMVSVCRDSQIAEVFDAARSESHFYDAYNPSLAHAPRLSKLLWGPVEQTGLVSHTDEVFFVPTGSLSRIPLESLPSGEQPGVLLFDSYKAFHRISHAREAAKMSDEKMQSAVLYGGLNYDPSGQSPQGGQRGYCVNETDATPTKLKPWSKLEWTDIEVRCIAALLEHIGMKVEACREDEGTVASFVALDNQAPDIIHIATHGFFETTASAAHLPALQSHDPMSLSGLVMSNGNEGWLHGTTANHEGIMTAFEIARLRLTSKLVVLSACDTGSGQVSSDGVYGLQRGFKKAGVQSLVMSLWSLDDRTGEEFMTLFYSRIAAGLSRHDAFNEARHYVMSAHKNNPALWAGLIMLD